MARKSYPWAQILSELQAHPNVWRLYPELIASPASLVGRIRRRHVRSLRAAGGAVEARAGWAGTTATGQNIADVYLRWRPWKESDGPAVEEERRPERNHPLDEHPA